MENATLTISLPRAMKDFIGERLREASFSTPSEYIRSLIRDDQQRSSRAARVRGLDGFDGAARAEVPKTIRRRAGPKRPRHNRA